MDESCRNDNTRPEVLRNKEDPLWYSCALEPFGDEWKQCTAQGADQDNENGRDPQSKVAVIVISSCAGRHFDFESL